MNLQKSFLLPILLLFFILASCSSEESEITKPDTKIITNYNYNETELRIVTLINNYRISKGLNTLVVINHISFKSEEHNIYMIDNNVVNHDYFQERSDNLMEVLGAEEVGENIAYNFQTAESVLSAWLSSSSHKANIEGDYTHIGVSVTINTTTGKKYYTNMFMK